MNTIFEKILHVCSEGLIADNFFRLLSRLGITIVPYYLFDEPNDYAIYANIQPNVDKSFELIFLDRSYTALIDGFDGLSHVTGYFQKYWGQDCECIGLICEDELLAFVWFDLKMCNYRYLSFELKRNEAFVFGMRTARQMRGRNIAPYLRKALLTHLAGLGRNRILSITESLNTPAIKYKKKLQAKPSCFYLYICLFDCLCRNFKIKSFVYG